MAGKSRNVPKREPSDSRFSNTLEHSTSMMSQNTTPRTMLNTPTLSNLVTKSNSIMTGLTGNLRQNTTIATGILDITSDSSGDAIPPRQIIVVDPEGAGTTDTLDAIDMNGVELEGAVITLLGVSGNTITITHNFTPAGTERAILCPTDMDFTLSNDDAIDLVYDKINTVWILKSAGNGGGAAASFPLDYPVDRQGSKSGTVTHDLSLTTGHKLVFTATADCDITISNIPTSASDAMDFYIEVIQDSTGGWAITANDSEWVNFPTFGTTADTTSLISCHADGDGNIRAVLLLNSTAASSGASKALDNLASPVLNVGIDFNSKAPTNFPGFTTPIVGQGFTISASGFAQTLPTGDTYNWAVNGVTVATLSSVGLGMGLTGAGSLNMNDNYITMDDISTPTIPGPGARRIFVDTATGELSVITNGGTTVSLEAGAEVTTWTANHDAAGFTLDNIGQINGNGANLATTGTLRLSNNQVGTAWRNAANGANASIEYDSSDRFFFRYNSGDPVLLLNETLMGWYFEGAENIRLAEDEIQFMTSGHSHKLSSTITALQLQASATADSIELLTGSARTNPTITVDDTETVFATGTAQTNSYVLKLLQNHDTPTTNRTIGSLEGWAENDGSTDTLYGRIEFSTAGSIAAGDEAGRIQLEVRTNGSFVNVMEFAGDNTSTTGKIGVFGTTEVDQQSGTGETTGFTANAGTGVNDDSTFTGNVGSTAYRINDIVKALKNYGWLAQ